MLPSSERRPLAVPAFKQPWGLWSSCMFDPQKAWQALTSMVRQSDKMRYRRRGKLRTERFLAQFAGESEAAYPPMLCGVDALEARAMMSAAPVTAAAESDFEFSDGVINAYRGPGGEVVVPSTIAGIPVRGIGQGAFSKNETLTRIVLPSGLASIAHDAFTSCSELVSVEIPSSVTSIVSSAFGSCANLTNIVVAPGNQVYRSRDGFLLSADGVALLKCPAGKAGDLVVPPSVTRIGDHAFFGCTKLSAITIPPVMKSIGSWAFADCTGLTTFNIPASVSSLGWRAFIGCSSLATITVADGSPVYSGRDGFLLSRDGKTLVVCPAGKSGVATVPQGVQSIGNSAFFCCAGLSAIACPVSVTRVEGWAFYGCSGLQEVAIPPTVQSVETFAFGECTGLRKITIPSAVVSIGRRVFHGCRNLAAIDVAPGNQAFRSRDGFLLTADGQTLLACPAGIGGAAAIPEGTVNIGEAAFMGCASLTALGVPASVGNIGRDAFAGCFSLNKIYFSGNAPASVGENAFGGLVATIRYAADATGWTATFSGLSAISTVFETDGFQWTLVSRGGVTITGYTGAGGDIIIPDTIDDVSVVGIGYLVFYNHRITSAQLPATLTTIGARAFLRCPITYVNVPASVQSIGDQAFARCGALTAIDVEPANESYASVDGVLYSKNVKTLIQCPGRKIGGVAIPATVTEIVAGAFAGCGQITSIPISAAVARIGIDAFPACYSLQAFTVDPANKIYAARNGALYDKSLSTLLQYPAGKTGAVSLAAGVNTIGPGAFSGCSRLATVTIPAGVRVLGNNAFFECRSLTSIQLPVGLASIGEQVFDGCSSLVSVTVPQGVTEIGQGAFNWCASLNSVSLPASVSRIGAYRFHGCTSLTSISVDSANRHFSIKDGLLVSKDGTQLIKCPGGRAGSVTVPVGVQSVEDNAFFGCGRVTSVTLPDSVTYVGGRAFDGCAEMTSIVLSPRMTILREGLFSGCAALRQIVIPRGIMFIGERAFGGCSNLTDVCFQGDAPANYGQRVFGPVTHPRATAYYVAGSRGWSVRYGGIPTKVAGTPPAVANLAATAANRQVTLSWQSPVTNGGSPVTSYRIRYARKLDAGWGPWVTKSQPVSAASIAVVTGLVNGATYAFSVSAVNAFGAGLSGTPDLMLTPMTVAGTPTGVMAFASGDGRAMLTWRAPTTDGGVPITDYVVQYRLTTSTTWSTADDGVATFAGATISGLVGGKSYHFRVFAKNAAGNSPASAISAAVLVRA